MTIAHNSGGPARTIDSLADTLNTDELRRTRHVKPSAARESRRHRLAERLFGVVQEPVRLGRFVLLEHLGSGGAGTVHLAYDPQLDRRVALKLLHPASGDSLASRARMLREAQALARLSHPNVVPVHDAGVVDEQVFIVMEYVRGRTLHEWVEQERPTWRQALSVYLQAGRGLAAAHAAGVIHRDFKPGNAIRGDDGRVRVLDFGLARGVGDDDELLDARNTRASSRHATDANTTRSGLEDPPSVDRHAAARSLTSPQLDARLTATGAVMGTPAYMAPEQFQGSRTDSRTDQFSFCAALWEALFGARPFAGDSVQELAESVQRGRPSAPAGARVPGWLQQIVARGLAVDRDARWRSMDELLAALGRDPTRTRWLLAAAGVVALSGVGAVALAHAHARTLAASCDALGGALSERWNPGTRSAVRDGLVGTGVSYAETTADKLMPWLDDYAESWMAARVEVCRAETIEKRWDRQLAGQAESCLDERRERALSLINQFASTEPGEVGEGVVQRALVATAGLPPINSCLNPRALALRPALPAIEVDRREHRRVRRLIAVSSSLSSIGAYDEAMVAAEQAQREADARGWDPLRAYAQRERGRIHEKLGEYEAAEEALESAFFVAARSLPDIDVSLVAIDLTHTVGTMLARHKDGARWGELALALLERAGLPEDDLAYARARIAFGDLHRHQGRYDEARAEFERAVTITEATLGPDHPELARALSSLAIARTEQGAYDEAITTLTRALALYEHTLGPDHPTLAHTLLTLGNAYEAHGDYDAALAAQRRGMAITEAARGPDHPLVAASLTSIGIVHMIQGHYDAAVEVLQRAATIKTNALGREHPDLAITLLNLGNALSKQGADDEALAVFRRALAISEAAQGPDHPLVANCLGNLGHLHKHKGEYATALQMYRRAQAIFEQSLGPEHMSVGHTLTSIGIILVDQREHDEAATPLRRAVAVYEAALGPDHARVATPLGYLSAVYLAQGSIEAALETAERGLEIRREALGPDHLEVSFSLLELAAVYRAQGLHAEAIDADTRALEIVENTQGPDHPDIIAPLTDLGVTHLESRRPESARPPLERALRVGEASPGETVELATLRFALARALQPDREQRARARELARRARDGYRDAGLDAQRAEIETWLARPRGS